MTNIFDALIAKIDDLQIGQLEEYLPDHLLVEHNDRVAEAKRVVEQLRSRIQQQLEHSLDLSANHNLKNLTRLRNLGMINLCERILNMEVQDE